MTKKRIFNGKWTTKLMPDQTGKVVIVTGANSGTGFETTKAFAIKKASVVMACRSLERGEKAVSKIISDFPDAEVKLIQLDLSDLNSIHQFAKQFNSNYAQLDILVNNAGVMAPPYSKTTDGFELQIGTNHLGHFSLTGLLLPLLLKTKDSRVVNMSSLAHRMGKIDFDDLNKEKKYIPFESYSQSKLANLLFTFELQRKFSKAGNNSIAVAAHPGWTSTNLQKNNGMIRSLNPVFGMTPYQGALPLIYASVGESVKGSDYFGPDGLFEIKGYPKKSKIGSRALDQKTAERLWKVSEKYTGISYSF